MRSQVEQLLSRRGISLLSDQARLELEAVARMAGNVEAALPSDVPSDVSPSEEDLPAAEEDEVLDEPEWDSCQPEPEASDEDESESSAEVASREMTWNDRAMRAFRDHCEGDDE